jgi:type VI secretion system protein ImpA
VLTDQADGDTSTNFGPAYDIVGRMLQAVVQYLPVAAAAGGVDDGAGGQEDPFATGLARSTEAGGLSGEIRNRDDVIRALDRICAYYERNEPGSPVPFALRRAKEWISLDFMAILEDIAPGSLQEATTVLKKQRSTGEDGW